MPRALDLRRQPHLHEDSRVAFSRVVSLRHSGRDSRGRRRSAVPGPGCRRAPRTASDGGAAQTRSLPPAMNRVGATLSRELIRSPPDPVERSLNKAAERLVDPTDEASSSPNPGCPARGLAMKEASRTNTDHLPHAVAGVVGSIAISSGHARRRTSCSTPPWTTPTSTPSRHRMRRMRSRSRPTGSRDRCRPTGRTSSGSTIGPGTTTTSTTTATASPTSGTGSRSTPRSATRTRSCTRVRARPGFEDPRLNVIQTYDLVREKYKKNGKRPQGEEGRQRPAGRAAEHRAEDVPQLRELRRAGDADAEGRHEAVRRHPRRSVLRRPRRRVRRDQRADGHGQRGPGRDDSPATGPRPP